jgi:hypothetical protein
LLSFATAVEDEQVKRRSGRFPVMVVFYLSQAFCKNAVKSFFIQKDLYFHNAFITVIFDVQIHFPASGGTDQQLKTGAVKIHPLTSNRKRNTLRPQDGSYFLPPQRR